MRWLAVLLVCLAGCATRIIPPADVADPAVVYLADHGEHSSLLVPAAEGYVQWSFGDWRCFALNENSLLAYARAALFSRRSALGREVHPTTDPAVLARRSVARLHAVTVERDRAAALLAKLEAAFDARRSEAVDNRHVRMTLVPAAGRYSAWNQCNTVAARWLRDLGCRVRVRTPLSSWKVLEPAG